MRNCVRNILFVICCLFLMTGIMHAQDLDRKWALSYNVSPLVKPVLTNNPTGRSLGRGFEAFTVMGEYYLPEKWTAEAGYFRAEIAYGGHSRTMEGIQLGGKKYFVDPDFFLQPYAAFATQFNWGRHYEDFHNPDGYYNSYLMKNPRLSIVPGVGAEIYMFTPIAFVVRYNFNIGIGSKTIIDTNHTSYESAYLLKDRGMYHNLELGVKITFPMTFTDDDGYTLLTIIRDLIFNF